MNGSIAQSGEVEAAVNPGVNLVAEAELFDHVEQVDVAAGEELGARVESETFPLGRAHAAADVPFTL
ncbi:MAG TPA: hypothetical protein PK890_02820 [Terrimesophilobacter sp.]|nr:hypothetical protein [Terrimesophilobacter sp.]